MRPLTEQKRYLKHLDHILSSLDVAFASYDSVNRTIAVSPSIETITGYPAEYFWQAANWVKLIWQEDLPIFHAAMEAAKNNKASVDEYRILTKSGEVKWIQSRLIAVYDEQETVYYESIIADITARKQMEKKAQWQNRRFRSLFDHNMDLVIECDLDGYVIDANQDPLPLSGRTKDQIIGESLLHDLMPEDREKALQLFYGARDGRSASAEVRTNDASIWSVSCTPITVYEQVQGIYVICRDITKQRALEHKLAESDRLFRLVSDSTTDIIAIVPPEGGATYVTNSLAAIIGYEPDEFISAGPLHFVYDEDIPLTKASLRQAIVTGMPQKVKLRYKHKNGHLVHMELNGTPIVNEDGRTESIVVVARDISDKVIAEEALQQSERRYRSLVELSPLAISQARGNEIVYMNPAACELIGAKNPEEGMKYPIEQFLLHGCTMEALEAFSLNMPFELEIRRLNGKKVMLEVRKGYDTLTGTTEYLFHDISERKQAENALKESEERYRLLFEMSPEPVMVVMNRRLVFVNPAAVKLLGGLTPADLIGRSTSRLVDSSYVAISEARLRRLEQGLPTDLEEVRMVRLDGGRVDVEVISSPITFRGKPAILSVFRDITQRKRLEQERFDAERTLKESEERFHRLQNRLDRFSKDLFGVMSIQQLEQRLIQEIQEGLSVTDVRILVLSESGQCTARDAQSADMLCRQLERYSSRSREIGELFQAEEGCYVTIGTFQKQEHILYLPTLPMKAQHESKRVWLKTMIRYVNNIYDNFKMIEDLTEELRHSKANQQVPAWFSRFVFMLSEKERRSLAQDLHDSALQEQIIWYRKLDMLLAEGQLTENNRDDLLQIKEGLLDVVYQIRLTCNELRPPLLKELGLVASLQQLFDITQLRTDFTIAFDTVGMREDLPDEHALSLYRIIQELLANAAKHSNASQVWIYLKDDGKNLTLQYEDNGIGIKQPAPAYGSMGLSGIHERARSLNGAVRIESSDRGGLSVRIYFPI